MRLRFWMLLLLLMIPLPHSQAQPPDETPLFTLSHIIAADDLGLEFAYPGGWYFQIQEGEVYIADQESDLPLLLDADPASMPGGFAIQLRTIPLADLNLADAPRIHQIVDSVIARRGFGMIERRDTSINGLHGVTLFGTSGINQHQILTIWLQDDQVMLFSMHLPPGQPVTPPIAATWRAILESLRPINPLPLTQTFEFPELGGFTMAYPEGWYAELDPVMFIVYMTEAQSDLYEALSGSDFKLDGGLFGFLSFPLDALGLPLTARPGDVAAALDFEADAYAAEYWLFDQPALAYAFEDEPGDYTYNIVGVVGTDAYVMLFGAPTFDQFEDFRPTIHAMLQSITPQP